MHILMHSVSQCIQVCIGWIGFRLRSCDLANHHDKYIQIIKNFAALGLEINPSWFNSFQHMAGGHPKQAL